MRLALSAFAWLSAASAASAASLGIDGTYGSPAGCKYAVDQVYGDESVSILDNEHYENFVTYCEFLQVLAARDGSKIVTLLCGHEGEEAQTIDMIRIARTVERDGYRLFHATGEQWDDVARCEAVGAKPR